MFTLGIFLENKLLFGIILAIVIINLGCIIYLVIKERKKDREEIDDILTSLKQAKPRETKEIFVERTLAEEEKKPVMEIQAVLDQMQKDLETTPEEVVSNFEQEQEEKSIISYQELVASLKKEEPIKQQIVEIFEDELEEELSKTEKIEVIDIDDEIIAKPVEVIEAFRGEPKKSEILVSKEETKKKFKNTEFISPIFGRMDSTTIDYPTVPQFSREEKLEELLEEAPLKVTRSIKNNLEETLDLGPLQDEIRKNDEFLRALKDFRSNL